MCARPIDIIFCPFSRTLLLGTRPSQAQLARRPALAKTKPRAPRAPNKVRGARVQPSGTTRPPLPPSLYTFRPRDLAAVSGTSAREPAGRNEAKIFRQRAPNSFQLHHRKRLAFLAGLLGAPAAAAAPPARLLTRLPWARARLKNVHGPPAGRPAGRLLLASEPLNYIPPISYSPALGRLLVCPPPASQPVERQKESNGNVQARRPGRAINWLADKQRRLSAAASAAGRRINLSAGRGHLAARAPADGLLHSEVNCCSAVQVATSGRQPREEAPRESSGRARPFGCSLVRTDLPPLPLVCPQLEWLISPAAAEP